MSDFCEFQNEKGKCFNMNMRSNRCVGGKCKWKQVPPKPVVSAPVVETVVEETKPMEDVIAVAPAFVVEEVIEEKPCECDGCEDCGCGKNTEEN